jgi:cellulose synthase/poly-beta-1,6-N-acetylglucosamine synthase-like glycosyltransferase
MWEIIASLYESMLFIYGVILLAIYGILAIMSYIAIRRFVKKNKYFDYGTLVSSPLTPGVSLIVPIYNKSQNLISNVRALLNLNYPVYEIIIVNDGSTDNSLELLITEFQLIKIEFAYTSKIQTQPIKSIFQSTQTDYSKIKIIDKINGINKADASNAGINLATYKYFLCMDINCILGESALLKLVEPILKRDAGQVIASNANVRLANSCDLDGRLITRVHIPRKLLPRFQEIEYIRSFVLNKVGWAYIHCVSVGNGCLGLINKEIAIKAGGYDFLSYGEDTDLIIRMCRYSIDNKIKYVISHLPITICWKLEPNTLKELMNQRTNWAIGLAKLVSSNISLLFTPTYGKMGMMAFPYIVFFEFLAPIIEFIGTVYFVILIILGLFNFKFALLLLLFVYSYSVMISTLAILWDQLASRYYKNYKEVILVCFTTFFELFLYRPFLVIFYIRGYCIFLSNRKNYGRT